MKAVLFDLDGTLLDTRDMILNSFRYAYTKVLGPDTLPPDDRLLSLVGIPLKTQMELIAPDKSEELFQAYLENNALVCETMLGGFDGAPEVLSDLREQGLRLAVVTSKRHAPAEHGLELMELDSYFEFILGSDDTAEHKPRPGPLLDAAERMGLAASDCAYVGDSPFDMEAAREAGMFAVGALWGMFTRRELEDAGAEVLLADIRELPELFAG
ncbi:MAG: HAD family hydrolase [Coriobacteriales bacterium]|nr:HAD family hydrolase [Coriobacteriales bacterium]